jgi:transcription initiation factor IIF auxiliary subunit
MIHKIPTEQKSQIPNIVFECGDFENDINMLLIEKEGEFHLHLHNSFTDDSMIMKVDIHDFAKMFDSLSEYFKREQIKIKTIKLNM